MYVQYCQKRVIVMSNLAPKTVCWAIGNSGASAVHRVVKALDQGLAHWTNLRCMVAFVCLWWSPVSATRDHARSTVLYQTGVRGETALQCARAAPRRGGGRSLQRPSMAGQSAPSWRRAELATQDCARCRTGENAHTSSVSTDHMQRQEKALFSTSQKQSGLSMIREQVTSGMLV